MNEGLKEIAWELGETSRLMRRLFNRRASALGVTSAQWRVMFWLGRQPGSKQVELAEKLDVEPITAGRTIDRLEEAGLVERRPDPLDRRAWRLYLTEQAEPMVTRLRAVAEDVLAEVFQGVDEKEIAALRGALERLRDNVTAMEAAERKSA
jgi:DNA-binding MarR family transcriptional regulator